MINWEQVTDDFKEGDELRHHSWLVNFPSLRIHIGPITTTGILRWKTQDEDNWREDGKNSNGEWGGFGPISDWYRESFEKPYDPTQQGDQDDDI